MRETRYARSGDAYIAYQVEGDGPIDLVIVTEGFIPVDMMAEEPHLARCLRRLAAFTRVIRFDRRGVGLSDPCAPTMPPSLEQWSDDTLAVLDAVGSERAAVLAANESGLVALMLAATHPERVTALILVNAFARALAAPDYPFGMPADTVDNWLDGVVDADASGAFDAIREFAPSVAGDEQFQRWWHAAGQRGASPSTARALLEIAFLSDLRDVLPTIAVPTLVLHYRDDVPIAPAHGRYIAENVPNATFVEVDGVDDIWWVGNADAVLDEIEEFLTGTRGVAEPDRVLATLLFTDIVASTDQVAKLGDRDWRELLDRYDVVVRRQLDRFAGRPVKGTGDGVLAAFDGPARAIRAASAIRDAARQIGLETRAGLHAGEIEQRGEDVAGIAVHVAARVCALAGANEIVVTRTLRDLTAGSGISFGDLGEHALKGVPDPWQLYRVEPS